MGQNKGVIFYHGHLTLVGISDTLLCVSAKRWLIKKRTLHVHQEASPLILMGLRACVRQT